MGIRHWARTLLKRRRWATGSFDDSIWDTLTSETVKLIRAGQSEEEAARVAAEALKSAIDTTTPRLAERLVKTAPRMLRWHRRQDRGFQRRLRRQWGRALDFYFIVLVCAEESGSNFNERNRPNATGGADVLFEALVGLHARACRVASEVHHLLNGGYPLGALARCRTLHEIAVTAMVLSEYGVQAAHADLAERFLLHNDVMSHADALVYQENCEALGYEPFTDEEMTDMAATRAELLNRFGRDYGGPYGWAAGLVAGRPATFRDLERLANVSHLRGHYRWASHEVHSDAKGWAMNIYERGDVSFRSTGAVNIGLADPGHMALISLHQCSVSLLLHGETNSPRDLIGLKAMGQLVDEAGDLFGDAEAAIRVAEEKLQARRVGRRDGSAVG